MDRFFAPHTPEAVAHNYLTENWWTWDLTHPSLDETLIAGCAAYQAFSRYLTGADLYLPPRNRKDLERVLRRHATDNIHNLIARARSGLQNGGYARICLLAEKSISNVLDSNDNATTLLAVHMQTPDRAHIGRRDESSGHAILLK
jgi:hypothetical protein